MTMISHVFATLGLPLNFEDDSIELEIVESSDTTLLVRLPDDTYAPYSINTIPYAFLNWRINTTRYAPKETVDVIDMVNVEGDVATLIPTLDMDSQSYLAIVYFMDSDGNPYPQYDSNGQPHPLAPILLTSLSGGIVAPAPIEGNLLYPQKPTEPLSENTEYIFAGWGDSESGAVYGAGAPIPVKLRALLALKPIWTIGFSDDRYAMATFDALEHGSFKGSDGTVLEEWRKTDDAYIITFNESYDTAHVVMKTSTFVIPSRLSFIPSSEGDWATPRFISSWVRVDGGDLIDPLNDTNKGFFLSDKISGKVFAGDHYGDLYYPGDILTLREGESARLIPVWAYAYTYRIIYDLTQFKTIMDSIEGENIDKENLLSELLYWMNTYGITPTYDESDAFTYQGVFEQTSAKKVLWIRIPSRMPPCATYFKMWITASAMLDTSTKFTHGLYSDPLTYLPPCPGQRVGLQIESGYTYECTMKAEWCDVGNSVPSTSVVYDDPDWVEPSNIEGIDTRLIVNMPQSQMVQGILYSNPDAPSQTLLDFRIRLAGTGKRIGESSGMVDIRPMGNGLYTLVKSFTNWNVRLNEDGTAQPFLAGDTLRIQVSGNVMASYYWGEFPGPMNPITDPPQVSRAWKFFKQSSGQASQEGVLWNDVIVAKAIWGPLHTTTDDDDPTLHTIDSIVYPEVVFAEASWKTQSGAHLIFGDYSKVNTSSNSGYVPSIHLPCIQSISDSLSNSLSETPTVAYGYENLFIMDIGSTRKIDLKITRINPPDYNDSYSEVDDPNEYYDESGTLLTGSTHPSASNKFFYADHWSNSKWYAMLREALNFWQNSLNSNNKSIYGGVQLFYSPSPLNSIEIDHQTVSNMSSSRPFYPNMLYNVFVTGSISPSFGVQGMTLTIPLTLSKMVTSEEATGTQEVANNWCVLYPYPSDYKIGERVSDDVQDNVKYIDSFNASRLIKTASRTSSDTWYLTTPSSVDGWTACRAYYEGDSTEPYLTNVPLSITSWTLRWFSNGTSRTATVNAGAQVDLGNATSVSLVAHWEGVIETVIVDAQKSIFHRENYMKGYSDRYTERQYDSSKDICFCIPEYATRMIIQMCGGGGAGGVPTKYSRLKWGFGGGGGAGGQRKALDVRLNTNATCLNVRVGRGGRVGSADQPNGESTTIQENTFPWAGISNDGTKTISQGLDSNWMFRECNVGAPITALGGPGGTTQYGGRHELDIPGVADGGDPGTNATPIGKAGESLEEFKGGEGGDASYTAKGFVGGGGGGGACCLSSKLRLRVPVLDGMTVKYEYHDVSFKSSAGRGFGAGKTIQKAEDGTYGGGGGGGQRTEDDGASACSRGGSGVVIIQFYGGGE